MTVLVQAIKQVVPDFQPPVAPPVWARLAGPSSLREQMQRAGFQNVEVTMSTRSMQVRSPDVFWSSFTRSAPPLAYLFQQLGPDRTAAVGRKYIEALCATSHDGIPSLDIEACIGIGRA